MDAIQSQDATFSFVSQDYPKNRHPGWSRGSIAYHAGEVAHDDLSVFSLHLDTFVLFVECFVLIYNLFFEEGAVKHVCSACKHVGNGTKVN